MQTKGVTRSKVSDETCSGAKPTHCNCRCYHGGLGIQLETVVSHTIGADFLRDRVLKFGSTVWCG